jgi:N utilization substance protein A
VVESTPKDFGRVAAQTARQVIQQRIREAERGAQMQYFERQIGEIISGVVQAVNNQGVTIGLDMKAEGALPNNQKIPGEKFRIHDRVRAIVMEVKDSGRGPQIVLSRSHRNFLRRLLENEVPEIYHGIVEIRAISREPGQRAKVAVSATQAGVDPVGACVGIKGVRIQAIVKELHVEWNADPVIYISKAVSPARVSGVFLNENEKTATVMVQEDQLSLAIGRDGQNARLAAKLTNWRIDIKSIVEAAGDTLNKLQTDPSLATTAEAEAGNVAHISEILAKKSENRPVTPEEYQALSQFVDRVERRTVERLRAAQKAEAERIASARVDIPDLAFEQPLDVLGLPEHVFTILTEADYRIAGDLILAMKTEPDKVLGLAGIGPKAMQAIEKAVAETKFEAPVPVEEPAPVAEVAPVVEPAAVMEVAEPESLPTETQTQAEPAPVIEAEPVVEIPVIAAEEEEEESEKSFEELFKLRPEIVKPVAVDDDDDKKDKKGKKKKSVELEFDESRGAVVGKKKHKRAGDWDEEW